MENNKRLIDAEAIARKLKNAHCAECNVVRKVQCSACWVEDVLELLEGDAVDAVEVVQGHWKEYSHSALVRWKDGEPVWADRSVFRCSRCDFGTIARHNYCPRCGAKMDGGNDNE